MSSAPKAVQSASWCLTSKPSFAKKREFNLPYLCACTLIRMQGYGLADGGPRDVLAPTRAGCVLWRTSRSARTRLHSTHLSSTRPHRSRPPARSLFSAHTLALGLGRWGSLRRSRADPWAAYFHALVVQRAHGRAVRTCARRDHVGYAPRAFVVQRTHARARRTRDRRDHTGRASTHARHSTSVFAPQRLFVPYVSAALRASRLGRDLRLGGAPRLRPRPNSRSLKCLRNRSPPR